MKTLLILMGIIFTGFSCSQGTTVSQYEPEQPSQKTSIMMEEFKEQVMTFRSGASHVDVTFDLHAQIFKLQADHPDFEANMAVILYSWKARKPIAVTVETNQIVKAEKIKTD